MKRIIKFSLVNNAVTLAEILITLGIIGVVAALTMPSVLNKYQAQVLRTHFLQANTIIYDGVQRAYLDDANMTQIMNDRDYNTLFKYFKSGNCKLPANEKEAKYYNYYGERLAYQAAASDLLYPYCLPNGQMLWLGIINNMGSAWVDSGYSLLAIDINGWGKKPDRYGWDVFSWIFDNNTGKLVPMGKEASDVLSANSVTSTVYFISCPGNKSHAEAGIGCTSQALSDADYFKRLSSTH